MAVLMMSLRDVGLAVVRMAPWVEDVGRWLYARLPDFLHDTPTSRLRRHFATESGVTFVQIGAYDGVAGDPIRPLVLENDGWSGVLIEPQPEAFEQLQRNYLTQASRLKLLNAAIWDRSGEKTLYCIPAVERERLGLADWAGEVASFSAEHLLKHFPQARPVSCVVRTMTFAEAAELLPAGRVDVVVIDAEGQERPIIETIDLDRHRVRFLVYEHKHLSETDRSAVDTRLQTHAFRLKAFGRDTIAFRSLQQVDRGRLPRADEAAP